MKNDLDLGHDVSLSALWVATCCVLPMVLMLIGLGGGQFFCFGGIHDTGLADVDTPRTVERLKWLLAGSTGLTMLAWIVVFNETRINECLLNQM